jgi:hypothetical protein
MTTPGIHSISDLLAVQTNSLASIGLDNVNAILQAQLAYDNALIGDLVADLASPVTVQTKAWGIFNDSDMTEVDEFGVALPTKLGTPLVAAFPLRKFAYRLGWTADFFERTSAADVAKQYLGLQDAYQRAIIADIRKAIMRSAGFTFVDRLTNNVSLTVKRLWDNDSGDVPPTAPSGTTFANSHTHYAAYTAIDATRLDALVAHVEEHGNYRGVKIMIAAADRATVEALTGFTGLTPAFIASNGDAAMTLARMDSNADLSNVLIGFWKNGESIYVKPYMPTYYVMCVATGMPDKVLGYRQPEPASLKGLRINAPLPDYPLFAENATAEFGFGVFNRGMAAMLYGYSGNSSTWADPV